MKKTILFLLFSMTLFAQAPSWHQYGVRTGTLFPAPTQNKIDVNARLKLNTTAGGFIPSWVTTTQRLAIASPQVGESVYDTTLNEYYHWDGGGWVESAGGSSSSSDLEAILLAGNVANNNFTLIGPTGTQNANYSGGGVQVTDGASGVINGIGMNSEYGGITGMYMNVLETGASAKSNTAYLEMDSGYYSTNGTRQMRFKLPFKSTSGIYNLVTADDIPAPVLPEHQIPFGQVGGVFGSDSTLTYEGGSLNINGNNALTTADGQPLDSDLTDISSLAPPNDNILQRKAGVWTSRTPAQFKTDLSLAKGDVGLGNVDNTSDANKPVSTAVASEYNSVSGLTFSGAVDLSKKGGSYYADHTQTGTITFSVSASTVGGLAALNIIANGSPINLVGTWKNVGSDIISTTSGAVNRMIVFVVNSEVWYSVKVN